MMEFEAVIGLEIHAQLSTESKLFCNCSTRFGGEPNTNTCPVCLGLPGVLPVLNEKAVEYALRAALALRCEIRRESTFARKNYFYPDLPKGYQITQFDLPLAENGSVEIPTESGRKKIGIIRIHMEEDAGKLLHGGDAGAGGDSLVDFNRAGVPLIEIVSRPDMRSPEEAAEYVKMLRTILLSLGVCEGNLERGNLRVDANVSIRPAGSKDLGTKTEIKNLNSYRFLQRALSYEIERQKKIISSGGKITQQTMLFDSDAGETRPMRSKEEAHDYRYFPEPDLLPLVVEEKILKRAKANLPDLPLECADRLETEYGIKPKDALLISQSPALRKYFEDTAKKCKSGKSAANWILSEALRFAEPDEIFSLKATPSHTAELINMIESGAINAKTAKEIFEETAATGKSPGSIVEERGLSQISDESELEKIISRVIKDNADKVEQYRSGKKQLFGFFMGQVMKASSGRANPKTLQKLLSKMLEEK